MFSNVFPDTPITLVNWFTAVSAQKNVRMFTMVVPLFAMAQSLNLLQLTVFKAVRNVNFVDFSICKQTVCEHIESLR